MHRAVAVARIPHQEVACNRRLEVVAAGYSLRRVGVVVAAGYSLRPAAAVAVVVAEAASSPH
jgi:hypothetical protein